MRQLISGFFFFFIFNLNASGSFLIQSASWSGNYALFQNLAANKIILVDVKNLKQIAEIDSSLVPLTWIKDSLILFRHEHGDTVDLVVFDIKRKTYHIADSFFVNAALKDAGNSDFVSFPVNISDIKNVFFVYVKGNKLYKFIFHERVIAEVADLPLGKDDIINNISVNNDGSSLLIVSRDGNKGKVMLMNLRSKKIEFEEHNITLNDEAAYAYFLQKDNEAVVYHIVKKVKSMRTIRISVLNIRKKIFTDLSNVQCVSLINPVRLYSKSLMMVNCVNPQNFKIKIGDSILADLIKALANSLSFIEVKYPAQRKAS